MSRNCTEDFETYMSPETKELDTTLAALSDCDLSEWDRDFVDDLIKRLARRGELHLTGKQWEQVERMKGKYL